MKFYFAIILSVRSTLLRQKGRIWNRIRVRIREVQKSYGTIRILRIRIRNTAGIGTGTIWYLYLQFTVVNVIAYRYTSAF